MTPVEVALEWASRGVPAFPVKIFRDANGKAQKKPLGGTHGHLDATTDPEKLRGMFASSRANGVGLRPGPAGFIVVDIDTKGAHDGFDTAATVGLPDTFTVTTPSGGEHRWFRKHADVHIGNFKPPGIDIRGDAGWVVAPGMSTPWGTWATTSEWGEVVTLPPECFDHLWRLRPSGSTEANTPMAEADRIFAGNPTTKVDAAVGWWILHADKGRHGGALETVTKLQRLHERQHPGVPEALQVVRSDFIRRVTGDKSRTLAAAEREWSDMVRDAAKVVASTPATSPIHTATEADEVEQGISARVVRGLDITRLPRPQWLVDGVLAKPSLAMLVGPPKQGKTFAALDLAASVVAGRPWMERTTSGNTVVYVIGEGLAGVGARLDAWSMYTGVTDLDGVHFVRGSVQLGSPAAVDQLAKYCRDVDADLVVLDTLARCIVGVEENSAKEMGHIIEHGLQRLRDASGCAVLAVHHTGKDAGNGARGSSALLGAVDTEVVCEKRGDSIRLHLKHQKDGIEGHTVTGHLEPVGESAVFAPGGGGVQRTPPNVDEVMVALEEIATADGVPTTAWKDHTGLPESTFYRARKHLVERFQVRNIGTAGRPRYVPNTAMGGGSNDTE
jgi:hypothetical protein